MVPPRVPQFNWIDLGLPSGTLWLDRLVGAPSPSDPGLYYQWGAVIGHTATDGVSFNAETYNEQGLNAISSDLSENQDAARAFYGPSAKMPSEEQIREFMANTSSQSLPNNGVRYTSLINGHSIVVYNGGYIENTQLASLGQLRVWTKSYFSENNAWALLGNRGGTLHLSQNSYRWHGHNIMAVHS